MPELPMNGKSRIPVRGGAVDSSDEIVIRPSAKQICLRSSGDLKQSAGFLKGPLYAVRRYSSACRQLGCELSNPAISLAGIGRLNK
jgi:hypothetical protein